MAEEIENHKNKIFVVGAGPSVTPEIIDAINADETAWKVSVTYMGEEVRSDYVTICDQEPFDDLKDLEYSNGGGLIDNWPVLVVGSGLETGDHSVMAFDYDTNPRTWQLNLPRKLYRGNSCGAFALNFALNWIPWFPVYLFGFDCQGTGRRGQPSKNYESMLLDFERFEPFKKRIFNCSENSAIETFKKIDWREAVVTQNIRIRS